MPQIEGSHFLVIGGAGFVGSHIVDQLIAGGAERVTVIDDFVRGTPANLRAAQRSGRVNLVEGSVLDTDLLHDAMHGQAGVFHLAALWLYECVHEPRKALKVNIEGTFNVAQAAVETKVPKVVYSSSASVYGNALTSPMTEEHPFNNRTMYGATKIAGEQFFRAFNEQHGLDYVGLRYMNVYGPRMDYKGTYVSVIMKVLDRIEAGQPPIVYGDGSHAYDFIHVDDVARANLLAMTSAASDVNLNVGSGIRTTINELVATMMELTGADLPIDYRPQEQVFVTERVGSTELAERLIGFRARIPYREGLRTVIEWRAQDKRATTAA